ncbi:Ig-like domain-containing protein [Agrococcus sp. 1P02AA]|uniref:Ig-like domain-containing protein n=1 Tax=Agrococcus sp. 1P02AA TaxID=3132259 RepID=UPI0039A50387
MHCFTRVAALVAALLLAVGALFAAPTVASAALIENDGEYGILDPRVDRGEYEDWMRVEVRADFRVPDDAQPGDTLQLQLPAPLDAQTFDAFWVTDPSGARIARAEIDADRLVTLTLTDFVLGRDDVEGDLRFWVDFRGDVVPPGQEQVAVDIFGTVVLVNGDVDAPGDEAPGKYGWFQGDQAAATAQHPDGSLVDPAGPHVVWAVLLHSGDWARVVLQDTMTPDLVLCEGGQVADGLDWRLEARDSAVGTGWGDIEVPESVSASLQCDSDSSFTVVIEKPTSLTEVQLRVVYESRFRTDAQGRPIHGEGGEIGFPERFVNHAQKVYDLTEVEESPASVIVLGSEGSGTGISGPAIDIEKYSGSWEGIVFEGGAPVMGDGPDLQPAVLPAGDFDDAPGAALDPRAATPITFTITNTGIEPLARIVVTDRVVTGIAIDGFQCDATDLGGALVRSVDGVVDMGELVLAPGAAFDCRGSLPALGDGAVHADLATVAATGVQTGAPVDDEDRWHGTTPDASPEPTSEPSPEPTPEPSPEPSADPTPSPTAHPTPGHGTDPGPGAHELPRTGAEPALVAPVAGVALLVAGAVLVLRRRSATLEHH